MARLVLVPALPALLARHPRLDLELSVTDRATDLARDGVDCALHVGDLDVGNWVERRIGSLPQGNYASPGYLERHGVPHHPSQLATHRAVRYASRSGTREAPWLYVENGAPRALAMRGAVKVNNADTQISCALAGLGLIQVPALDVHDHLADGTLVEVMPHWRAPPVPMSVFHAHQRHVSPRVLAFADWVRELFRDHLAAGPAPAPLRLAG
jgi:DNA-binding transcriptional LysR family regulator